MLCTRLPAAAQWLIVGLACFGRACPGRLAPSNGHPAPSNGVIQRVVESPLSTESSCFTAVSTDRIMLAPQRATSQSALQRAGLGLLRTLTASDTQPAAGLLYSHQRAYADAQPGAQSSDLSPDLAWTISDAIASTQPEYWPRLSQPKLPAPALSQVTLDQKARTFSLQEAVQLLLVWLVSHASAQPLSVAEPRRVPGNNPCVHTGQEEAL